MKVNSVHTSRGKEWFVWRKTSDGTTEYLWNDMTWHYITRHDEDYLGLYGTEALAQAAYEEMQQILDAEDQANEEEYFAEQVANAHHALNSE